MKRGIVKIAGKFFLGFILLQGYGLFGEPLFVCSAKQMIEVSVDAIEITETNLKKLGVEWIDAFSFEEGSIPSILTEDGKSRELSGFSGNQTGLPYDVYKIGKMFRTTPFMGTLHALINNNEARLLANPKLVTESGSNAHFLVGGEIPYVYYTEDEVIIEWKEYGVALDVQPEVVDKVTIRAKMKVEVVEIGDWYTYGIFRLPSFTKREMSNRVMIKNKETLVIAGLKKSAKVSGKRRVPLLGYIPIIGDLFFTYADTKDVKSSLVMFVTFKIIR
ncbi:type II and III secretion system protein [bacterium]|nr:type II and III secretion system protein [bacterium]